MIQRIVTEHPPIFADIVKVFPAAAEPNVFFSFGDVIYNPSGTKIEQWVLAHEHYHGTRQLECGVKSWWETYLVDPEFRLREELPAHVIEYKEYRALGASRNQRRQMLGYISERLASPLYGGLVSHAKAKALIKEYGT